MKNNKIPLYKKVPSSKKLIQVKQTKSQIPSNRK